MTNFNEHFPELEYFHRKGVKRYDCFSMWIVSFIVVLQTFQAKGQPAVGIREGDVFMNWTINDTGTLFPRYIRNPRNENMVYFRIGETNYTYYAVNYTQRITEVGDVSHRFVSFRLSKLTVQDAGRYSFQEVQIGITLDFGGRVLVITVPPEHPVVTEFTPAVEGTDYRLSCSASSNSKPSNHGLPMISEWKVRGQSIVTGGRYTIIGTELTIARLTFQDNGATLSCSVYEDPRVKSDESTVWILDIKYGPENVLLTTSDPTIVLENSSLSIKCTADCNPPCNFQWRRGSSAEFVSISQIMDIQSATKNDADNYTCFVSNSVTMLTRTISTMIIVNYGAEIKTFSVQEGTEVNENGSATFLCSVDSRPKSSIILMKQSSETELKRELDVLQSEYEIKSANCLDTGNYTCSAYNGVLQTVATTIQFFVKCHPRTDFRSSPARITYSKRHGDAILKYSVISYPPSIFTWIFIGNGSEHKDIPSAATQYSNGQQSELRFKNLEWGDFGLYRVSAENNVGSPAMVDLELVSADVPEIPDNVTITDVTHNSLRVQWVSAFSGGPEQTFNITAKMHDVSTVLYAPDPGYRKVGIAMINSLMPNTKYNVYFSANNSIGTSNITLEFVIFTEKEQRVESMTGLLIAGVAGGLGAVCGVILVSVAVVILWRRYQVKTKSLDAGFVGNSVYDPSVLGSSSASRPGAEYAFVEKSKKKAASVGDLYAQVDKPSHKGREGKNGDVYENANLVMKRSADKVYENTGQTIAGPSSGEKTYEHPEESPCKGQLVNDNGLQYADVVLGPPTFIAGKPLFHGLENRTEYAEIDYGKRGEPILESDEEKGSGGAKNNNGTKLNTDE